MNVGFKKGMVLAWSGAVVDIPNGWSLCDGTPYKGSKGCQTLRKTVISSEIGGDPEKNWAQKTGWSNENLHDLGIKGTLGAKIINNEINENAYHGPFGTDGSTPSPYPTSKSINKTFTNLPEHTKLQVKLRLWVIDTWDNEKLHVDIDNTEKWSKTYKYDNMASNVYTGNIYNNHNPFQGNNTITYEDLKIEIDHTDSSVNITIKVSSGDGQNYNNEYWAFSNFELSVIDDVKICDNDEDNKPDLRGKFIKSFQNYQKYDYYNLAYIVKETDDLQQQGEITPYRNISEDGDTVSIGQKGSGAQLCIGETCINEEELQALKNLKSGIIKGDLQVTGNINGGGQLNVTGNANIGSAYIGSSKAHGAGWAEFSNKNRGAGGGDYSIISDASGHTLLNSKVDRYVGYRNNNNQHAYVNHHGHIHTNSTIQANGTISTSAYLRSPMIQVGDINGYNSKKGDIKDHNFIMRPSGGQIVSMNNAGHGSIVNASRRADRGNGQNLEWHMPNNGHPHATTPLVVWGNTLQKHGGTGNYFYGSHQAHDRWYLH